MKDFYEAVWEQRPELGEPWRFERRCGWLLERLQAGARVLDLGCGTGAFTAALAEAGAAAVGADVAEAALGRARAAHPAQTFVLVPPHGPFPFADGAFDAVWASEVVEHVADTAAWLSEVRRVLAPGGRLLITTPFHGRVKNVAIALTRFESHYEPVGEHLRFYTRASLRGLFEDFGFSVAELGTQGGPPFLRESLMAVATR